MDIKRIEVLSNMRFMPPKDISAMYETIVNYSRELLGARKIVFYTKGDEWKKEFSYPSEEMLGFELEGDFLENIFNKFKPSVFSNDESKKIGISTEGYTLFLPLGTKGQSVGLLLLVGIKISSIEDDLPIFKIFSRYLEIYVYSTKKLLEKKTETGEGDILGTMKMDIISMISRDLRTPLSSILAYAETLKKSESLSKEETSEFIKTIYDESLRLKEIIENVVNYIEMIAET